MSTHRKQPPLLVIHTHPSGPMAAPLGPPPQSATTSTAPSAPTLLSVPRAISTTSTLPSSSGTGPSGKRRPVATVVQSMGAR